VIPLFLAYQAHKAKGEGDMATAAAKASLATKVGFGMFAVGFVINLILIILNVVLNA
jgi:hypothetical protein